VSFVLVVVVVVEKQRVSYYCAFIKQLFGDTVNTASRMESTGHKGRIQMSAETADLLVAMGKSHLIRQREDTIVAKGKGELTTFWVALGVDRDDSLRDDGNHDSNNMLAAPTLSRNTSTCDSITEGFEKEFDSEIEESATLGRKAPTRRRPPAVSMSMYTGATTNQQKKKAKNEARLVNWMVEVLSKLLKHVIARRQAVGATASDEEPKLVRPEGQTVLEEVREIIMLPIFDESAAKRQVDPEEIELDEEVKEQLRDYVAILFTMYRDNPFHNAAHASHVTMSVIKLLSRIVAPRKMEWTTMTSEERVAAELHDHTYGITSDPLTQFAVVLSALIHDGECECCIVHYIFYSSIFYPDNTAFRILTEVDHNGIPNAQLVNESASIAKLYKGKSVAEQNSVDLSWNLLMEPQFKELRAAIYCNDAELTRFRSLVVNTVMATDIVDKELKELRNARWDRAFRKGDFADHVDTNERDAVNRKATIVIEHLIQASDVSHTMQVRLSLLAYFLWLM